MKPLSLNFQLAALLLIVLPLGSCTKEARVGRKMDSASEHLRNSKFSAAEIEYKNALEMDPGNAKAMKGLGIIWVRQGVLLEAARVLTTAKEALPQDREVAFNRARALFGMEFVEDSRAELESILDKNPDDGEALMLYAETSIGTLALNQCEDRIGRSKRKDDKWVRLAAAMVQLRRGAVEAGSSEVEQVLRNNPDFGRALALQATVFRVRKFPEKALELMKKAAELGGPRSEESVAVGTLLMETKHPEEAVAWFKAAAAKAPDYVPTWYNLGRIAFAEGKDEDATGYLAKAFRLAPLDIPSGLLQAQIWMRGKEPQKAMELLDKLASTFPSRPRIDLELAKACLAAGKPGRATDLLDSVIRTEPDALEAIVLRARVHLGENEPAEAARQLEEALAKHPDNPEIRDVLVTAYDVLGRTTDAVDLLTKAVADSASDPMTRFWLAQHLLAQGETAKARAELEAVAKSQPEDLRVIAALAVADMQEKKPANGMARIDDYISTHPDSNDALRLKAEIFHRSGDLKGAEAAALKALEIQPDDLAAYGIVVQVLVQEGRAADAVEQLRKLIGVHPDNERAKLHIGILLQQLGRADEARAAFEKVLETSPESASALNNLAYLESADPAKLTSAREHAAKARQLDPRDPAIADTLGWIEMKLGNEGVALPLLTQAAAGMPDMPSVQYHLGVARYSLGQSAEAEAAFGQALASGKDFPEKEDARNRLELLRGAGAASIADLEKRVAADPRDVPGRLELARRHAAGGKPDEALAAYQAALEANPSLPAAYAGIARLYLGPLNSPEKAMEAATKARTLAPRDPESLAVLGAAKLRAGLPQEAYGLLSDASPQIHDDPEFLADFAEASYLLGRQREAREIIAPVAAGHSAASAGAKRFLRFTDPEAGRQEGIAAAVEKAIAENPRDIAALMLRGALETAAGRNAEATYRDILKFQPGFTPAQVRLAGVLMDDPAKLEEALKLAREARGRMPADAELAGILGIASYRNGDFSYAVQVLNELAGSRQLDAVELFSLGMSQAKLKDASGAADNLQKAIAAGLDDKRAAEAKAELEKPATGDSE